MDDHCSLQKLINGGVHWNSVVVFHSHLDIQWFSFHNKLVYLLVRSWLYSVLFHFFQQKTFPAGIRRLQTGVCWTLYLSPCYHFWFDQKKPRVLQHLRNSISAPITIFLAPILLFDGIQVSPFKLNILGLFLSQNLKWKVHVSSLIKSAFSGLCVLYGYRQRLVSIWWRTRKLETRKIQEDTQRLGLGTSSVDGLKASSSSVVAIICVQSRDFISQWSQGFVLICVLFRFVTPISSPKVLSHIDAVQTQGPCPLPCRVCISSVFVLGGGGRVNKVVGVV